MAEAQDKSGSVGMVYHPNPAHKLTTTEAGPPRWYPDKEPCPQMSLAERESLFRESIPIVADDPKSNRVAVRRADHGLELYIGRLTQERADGTLEFHGHPVTPGRPKIPPAALRELRDSGKISEPEYRRLVRQ